MKSATATPRAKANKHENIVNDDAKLHDTFGVGDVVHQGDLIIVGIASLPASSRPRNNRQLADGTSQGSRHVLVRGDLFDADPKELSKLIADATKCEVGEQYIGPVFVGVSNPTCDDLTHPEHGNHGFPASQVCAVVYQRSLDSEEREQRVRD